MPTFSVGVWLCALWLVGPSRAPLMADEPESVLISAEVREAVADLSSAEFSRRQNAEQRLIAQGSLAFEPLIASLGRVPQDAGQRILLILERIWLKTPEPQSDVLERLLEKLRLSVGPYQPDIAQMLQAHHRLREERAVRILRRLNAIVEEEEDEREKELANFLWQPLQKEPIKRVSHIILPRSWKGTEADLWHIQRLSHLKFLTVFVVENNGVTEAAKQTLHVGFPDILVVGRSEIFLGVTQEFRFGNENGCRVSNIQEGSSAEIAGVQPGDLIQSVDGKPISNFDGLVNALKTKHAYQSIELQVLRGEYTGLRFEEEHKPTPIILTAIGIPWETRRFPTPPPPPMSESWLPDLPFPSMPLLPSSSTAIPVPELKNLRQRIRR